MYPGSSQVGSAAVSVTAILVSLTVVRGVERAKWTGVSDASRNVSHCSDEVRRYVSSRTGSGWRKVTIARKAAAVIVAPLVLTAVGSCAADAQRSPEAAAEALLDYIADENYDAACALYTPMQLAEYGDDNCRVIASNFRAILGGDATASADNFSSSIEGDRASVNFNIDGQRVPVPLKFVRMSGRWYLVDD